MVLAQVLPLGQSVFASLLLTHLGSRLCARLTGYTCNPKTWEAEAGGSEVQGNPLLPSELEASLGYMGQTNNQGKSIPTK